MAARRSVSVSEGLNATVQGDEYGSGTQMQRGDLGDALDSGIGAHAPLNMIQHGIVQRPRRQ